MSCAPFTHSSRGRRGVGVVQPQSGLDYPLVNPSADIEFLIADFYFSYDYLAADNETAQPHDTTLKIAYLYGIGCNGNTPPTAGPVPRDSAPDIVLQDLAGRTVFDTTTMPLQREQIYAWGPDYVVYEWVSADAVCRLLAYTTWAEDDDSKRYYDKYLAPANAVIDSRAVYRMPRRLLSLAVRNGDYTTEPYKGDIQFKNSYNTELVAGAPTVVNLRRQTAITFSAVPGSGAGKYPCLSPPVIEYPIKTINGAAATAGGHVQFNAKDCVWVRRPVDYPEETPETPIPAPASQQAIGADCKPCCACTDYAATAMFMNYTRDRYKLIGQRAADVKVLHEGNITRWEAYRACTISNPLRVIVVPQRTPFVDASVVLCNNCDFCMAPSTLTLTIDILTAKDEDGIDINIDDIDATIVCGYTQVFFPGVAAKTITVSKVDRLTYVTNFPQLSIGGSASVQFRLEFSVRAEIELQARVTGVGANSRPIPYSCGIEEDEEPAEAITRTIKLPFTRAGRASREC